MVQDSATQNMDPPEHAEARRRTIQRARRDSLGFLASVCAVVTGCATTPGLLEDGRYFEACERVKGTRDATSLQVQRAVAAKMRGVVRMHVLSAEEIETAAGMKPKNYAALPEKGWLWVVEASVTLDSAASRSVQLWMMNRDSARWSSDRDVVASAIFGLPPAPRGTTTSAIGAFLEAFTLGLVRARTDPEPDPYGTDARRAAADRLNPWQELMPFVPVPGTAKVRAFFASAASSTMTPDDALTIGFEHGFSEPEGHWACVVDVRILVPLRSGTTLREQLDGLTIKLPVDPSAVQD